MITDLERSLALRRVTASKLDLAVHCTYWASLDISEEPPTLAMQIGTAFHEFAAFGELRSEVSARAAREALRRYQRWDQRDVAYYGHETAYCLHTDGAVSVLGQALGRDYSSGSGLCGTIDALDQHGQPVDWKTGSPLGTAQESWQLAFAAIVTTSYEGKFGYVQEDGSTIFDTARYDSALLSDRKNRLLQVIAETPTEPRRGPHCRRFYCRARAVCPAWQTDSRKEKNSMKMSIKNISRGKQVEPYRVVLYGPAGVGKSTWAANAPSPVFLDPDSGTGALDVARFGRPESWSDCLEALKVLASEHHDYRTLVIDTLDAIEPLIHAHVCAEGGKASVEEFGYGKGYVLALDEWRRLIGALQTLHERGMHVVLLAHSNIRPFKDPASDPYDRYELRLHAKAAAAVKDWASAVLFCNYKITRKTDKNDRVRALGDGSRVVYTDHRPAWDAKNRYNLPFELPLDYAEFDRLASLDGVSLPDARAEAEQLVALLPTERQERARAAIAAATDARKLTQIIDYMRSEIGKAA